MPVAYPETVDAERKSLLDWVWEDRGELFGQFSELEAELVPLIPIEGEREQAL